ncbi:hypothetical protein DUZ99_03665 [Xylanibacillus composti]|uniref:Uncharacterized protein n=1 Tax=Xylanibacillus composti TaxID=1572762 RepID=A0A8J4H613_9BACL|nr:hypothetical protein [Xylanibacillus composti]GIQ69489.1 hypothetical protein XYCOK13_23130 [Xylanibacillus composti]
MTRKSKRVCFKHGKPVFFSTNRAAGLEGRIAGHWFRMELGPFEFIALKGRKAAGLDKGVTKCKPVREWAKLNALATVTVYSTKEICAEVMASRSRIMSSTGGDLGTKKLRSLISAFYTIRMNT